MPATLNQIMHRCRSCGRHFTTPTEPPLCLCGGRFAPDARFHPDVAGAVAWDPASREPTRAETFATLRTGCTPGGVWSYAASEATILDLAPPMNGKHHPELPVCGVCDDQRLIYAPVAGELGTLLRVCPACVDPCLAPHADTFHGGDGDPP